MKMVTDYVKYNEIKSKTSPEVHTLFSTYHTEAVSVYSKVRNSSFHYESVIVLKNTQHCKKYSFVCHQAAVMGEHRCVILIFIPPFRGYLLHER